MCRLSVGVIGMDSVLGDGCRAVIETLCFVCWLVVAWVFYDCFWSLARVSKIALGNVVVVDT